MRLHIRGLFAKVGPHAARGVAVKLGDVEYAQPRARPESGRKGSYRQVDRRRPKLGVRQEERIGERRHGKAT